MASEIVSQMALAAVQQKSDSDFVIMKLIIALKLIATLCSYDNCEYSNIYMIVSNS